MRVALTKAAVSGLPGGAAMVPPVAVAPTAVRAAMAGAGRVGAAEDDEAPRVRHAGAIGTLRTLTQTNVPSWAPMHPVPRRYSLLAYSLYAPSSRLAGWAPRCPQDDTPILISVLTVVPCDPEWLRPPLRTTLERVGRSSLLVGEES